MRTITAFALALLPGVAVAQFASGSNGSMGALNVTSNTTLAMPPDGVFHYTTITIDSSDVLTFTPNARNTPVYLLATGDVIINGAVSLNGAAGTSGSGGRGGPGGFDGGEPLLAGDPPGDGHGPGAGLATTSTSTDCNSPGYAAHGLRAMPNGQAPNALDGDIYGGPLLTSLVGGSGGGGTPSGGGGGGGGAILLASNTRIVFGSSGAVNAVGGGNQCGSGGGSGGAIRLAAPTIVGGVCLNASAPTGGSGRVRIDTLDRSGMTLEPCTADAVVTVGRFLRGYDPNPPRLDIVSAAGTAIPPGSGAVEFTLPFGSPAQQDVTVRASGFTGTLAVELVVTPESGSRTVYPLSFDMTTDPQDRTVTVTLPLNQTSRIEAWAK